MARRSLPNMMAGNPNDAWAEGIGALGPVLLGPDPTTKLQGAYLAAKTGGAQASTRKTDLEYRMLNDERVAGQRSYASIQNPDTLMDYGLRRKLIADQLASGMSGSDIQNSLAALVSAGTRQGSISPLEMEQIYRGTGRTGAKETMAWQEQEHQNDIELARLADTRTAKANPYAGMSQANRDAILYGELRSLVYSGQATPEQVRAFEQIDHQMYGTAVKRENLQTRAGTVPVEHFDTPSPMRRPQRPTVGVQHTPEEAGRIAAAEAELRMADPNYTGPTPEEAALVASGQAEDQLAMDQAPQDQYYKQPAARSVGAVYDNTVPKRTDSESKRFNYSERMSRGTGLMTQIEMVEGVPDAANFLLAAPKAGDMTTIIAQSAASDHAKRYMTSAQLFLAGILRDDSGAAIPLTEYPQYWVQFIPMPGDSEQLIAMKQGNRELALKSMVQNAGMTPEEQRRNLMRSLPNLTPEQEAQAAKFRALGKQKEDEARLAPNTRGRGNGSGGFPRTKPTGSTYDAWAAKNVPEMGTTAPVNVTFTVEDY